MLRVIPFLAGGLKYVCRYVFARLSADQKRRRGCSELEGRGEGKNECYAVLVQGPPVQTTQSLCFPQTSQTSLLIGAICMSLLAGWITRVKGKLKLPFGVNSDYFTQADGHAWPGWETEGLRDHKCVAATDRGWLCRQRVHLQESNHRKRHRRNIADGVDPTLSHSLRSVKWGSTLSHVLYGVCGVCDVRGGL
jgi:hypothetical protein